MRCRLAGATSRGMAVVLASAAVAAAADPGFYLRRDTWQATLIASREALMKQEDGRLAASGEPADGAASAQSFDSGATGRKQTRRLRLRVRGLKVLWLAHFASGGGRERLAGCWADAQLTDADGRQTPLHALKPIRTVGQAPRLVSSAPAGARATRKRKRKRGVRLGRKQFAFGLVVTPDGELCYRLDGKYEWFQATVGLASAKDRRAAMRFLAGPAPGRELLRRERDREALWRLIERDFSSPAARREIGRERQRRIWQRDWKAGDCAHLAARYARHVGSRALQKELRDAARRAKTPADVIAVARRYHRWQDAADAMRQARQVNLPALRRAVEHLTGTFGRDYPRGREYLRRIAALEKADLSAVLGKAGGDNAERAAKLAAELVRLQRRALLDNPLLDFDKLLLVRRSADSPKLGLPQNWQGNCALPRTGYDNEICTLSPVSPEGKLTRLYRPKRDVFVGDVDLHFDADRLLFSSLADTGRWQVFEMRLGGSAPRQVTRGRLTEVDNYDPCYLPNGRIVFASSAVMQGVPCVGGRTPVSNLFIMDADGAHARQLCFDQDHDWCPTVLPNGRVMYTRWEYTDTPHYFTRLLFHMNPDGTRQMELYGSNSYWPNSIFYARPVPNHPTKLVAVISGHHGVPRMGELVVFDPAQGRHEADGAVQRIPGHGKRVEAVIRDRLVSSSWPKFLHPWPLSDKYFLVSCQMDRGSDWQVCLVDAFDNILPLCGVPGSAILEPVPLRRRPRPPVIPARVDLRRRDAVVYMTDVYAGGGLAGVPRGAVRKLRVFEWHYAYQRMGGHRHVAVEGGWDVKRILGTVPVEADGSAMFRVPANTPLAVQPLDRHGRALQLMRSWFTAMPGEVLSCVGCHERQSDSSPNRRAAAAGRLPREITSWYGPTRGFGFRREVQPVLDKYCLACHNADNAKAKSIPDLADTQRGQGGFTKSYIALHPYVRRPGPESDYHMLAPADYLANTSELVQMLRKGHHNVCLDAEAWDRLYTWIDLNVPDHGTWTEYAGEQRTHDQRKLRAELRKLYANIDEDPETIPPLRRPPVKPVRPPAANAPAAKPVSCPGWPFDAAEAKRRQARAGAQSEAVVDLGEGVRLRLVLVPAGEFVMGDRGGRPDERPPCRVRIDRPFWLGRTEVTNRQYRRFDPSHDSRFIDQHWKDHTTPGYSVDGPDQPVVRISWRRAMAFCRWLTARATGPGSPLAGQAFTLPTEAQWEYACRAGTAMPLFYGGLDDDFSAAGNMADASISKLAVRGVNPKPIANPRPFDDFLPKDARFSDGRVVAAPVGQYRPNAWGLLDMHGNVAEWTRSAYRPYPYRNARGGDGEAAAAGQAAEMAVRGGSWRDRPKRCRSAFRLHYPSWQAVFDVGFRVACEAGAGSARVAGAPR